MISRRRFILSALGVPVVVLEQDAHAVGSAQTFVELDPKLLSDLYPDLEVAFYAHDLVSDSPVVMNAAAVDARHTPWSTFKIPNLVIALETEVARDLGHRRAWDPVTRPAADYWPQNWRQDQSLAAAFKRSVVWYFQDIAMDVGTQRYRTDLVRFGYGNAKVPDRSDDFWLRGPLKISPREHAEFLKRIIDGSLGISVATKDALREVSSIKVSAHHALHGKTGSGPLSAGKFNGPFGGWFVGWVERDDRPTVTFALYVKGPDYPSFRTARQTVAELILKITDHLPTDWS